MGTQTEKRKWFQDKTLWDWLQLAIQLLSALAIPIAIAVGTQWFSYQQSQTSLQIAQDQQRETILETYLDRMSDLLITHRLHSSPPTDETRRIAQARTLIALQILDPEHKGVIIRFLHEADLITAVKNGYAIVRLDKADLRRVVLHDFFLDSTDLHDTFLNNADLSNTILIDTNISIADLSGANLSGADLRRANLVNANLSGADLSGAILTGAIITNEQLSEAKSLKHATMPNGTKHP